MEQKMSEQNYNFEVPGNVPAPRRGGNRLLGILLLLQLVTMLVLGVWALRTTTGSSVDSPKSAAQLKSYAMKLENQGVPRETAEAWKEYLKVARLSSTEEAKVWYHIGVILQDGRIHDEALACFTRSESVARVPDLEAAIASRTLQCLQALGRVGERDEELRSRTSITNIVPDEPVLVQMGPWKLTRSRALCLYERVLDIQLRASGTPVEQILDIKKKALDQMDDNALRRYLKDVVTMELLYRAGCDDKLYQDLNVREQMLQSDRTIIANEYMRRALKRIMISPSDVQDFYKANPQYFTVPAGQRLSHIQLSQEERANQVLKKLQEGQSFASLVKEYSEGSSRDNSGEAGWCTAESGGWRKVALETLAAHPEVKPGMVCPVVIHEGDQWHVVKLLDVRQARLMKYDEPNVQDQARQLLMRRKQAEVQKEVLEKLAQKYELKWMVPEVKK